MFVLPLPFKWLSTFGKDKLAWSWRRLEKRFLYTVSVHLTPLPLPLSGKLRTKVNHDLFLRHYSLFTCMTKAPLILPQRLTVFSSSCNRLGHNAATKYWPQQYQKWTCSYLCNLCDHKGYSTTWLEKLDHYWGGITSS